MDMQDKDFDELFRSMLDSFEAEPSANIWPGITGELDSARRRRNLASWLSIAASIVVLTGVGLFFIPKKANTGTKAPEKNPMAVAVRPVIKVQTAQTRHQLPAVPDAPAKLKHEPEIARVENRPIKKPVEAKTVDTVQTPAKTIAIADHQLMANIPAKSSPPIKAVVPDVAVQLAVKSSIDQLPGSGHMPDKLAGQDLADNKKDSVLVKRKHKIHNFGDLVNVVVDKLDKRKDKVIQFADDEDGDSHITGVNLGIVKIKKGE
jgi:hypothetical protein